MTEELEQLKQMIEKDNLKDGDYVIIMFKMDYGRPKVENVYRNFKHLRENYQKDADSIHEDYGIRLEYFSYQE